MMHVSNGENVRSCWGALRAVALGAAMALAMGAQVGWAEEHDEEEEPTLEVLEIYFELNDTDGDLGIHGLIDGEPWKKLVIYGPEDEQNVKVKLKQSFREQGLTEFFFESAEPNFDDLDPADFFARFPEGEYEAEAVSIEGDVLENETELTHLVPAAPAGVQVSGEDIGEDCDDGPIVSVSEPVVISWDPVTLSHAELGRTNEPIVVDRYQVVVEYEESELSLSVLLPDDATSFTVPSDFIALGEEFKFEILVREDSGNQSAVESCFEMD